MAAALLCNVEGTRKFCTSHFKPKIILVFVVRYLSASGIDWVATSFYWHASFVISV